MQILKNHMNSLGSENYDVLGFKSEEELHREILKLIKVRSEFEENKVVISIK